jgi:hypothetical protein
MQKKTGFRQMIFLAILSFAKKYCPIMEREDITSSLSLVFGFVERRQR